MTNYEPLKEGFSLIHTPEGRVILNVPCILNGQDALKGIVFSTRDEAIASYREMLAERKKE